MIQITSYWADSWLQIICFYDKKIENKIVSCRGDKVIEKIKNIFQ